MIQLILSLVIGAIVGVYLLWQIVSGLIITNTAINTAVQTMTTQGVAVFGIVVIAGFAVAARFIMNAMG